MLRGNISCQVESVAVRLGGVEINNEKKRSRQGLNSTELGTREKKAACISGWGGFRVSERDEFSVCHRPGPCQGRRSPKQGWFSPAVGRSMAGQYQKLARQRAYGAQNSDEHSWTTVHGPRRCTSRTDADSSASPACVAAQGASQCEG